MENMMTRTIGEFVNEDHRAAAVFEKYSIDFCCNGGRALEVACREKGIDPDVILGELKQLAAAEGGNGFRPDGWDLDVLADYIVNNHHRYLRTSLPAIQAHLEKVVSKHGANHPELLGIADRFSALAAELTGHMQKEEMVLFPYVRTLASASRGEGTVGAPHFGTVRNPIRAMEAEHRSAGEALAFIREASAGYLIPVDACTTFRLTYRELDEFEQDLHRHIHLENNILFPRAITLEAKIAR